MKRASRCMGIPYQTKLGLDTSYQPPSRCLCSTRATRGCSNALQAAMSSSRPRRAAVPASQTSTPTRQARAVSSQEPSARSTRRQAASKKVSYADVTALSDPEELDAVVKDEEMGIDEPEVDADEDDVEPEEELEAEVDTPRIRSKPKAKKGRKGGRGAIRLREAKDSEREGTEMEDEDGDDTAEVSANGTRITKNAVYQLEEGGEECVLPDDEKGDTKVDSLGRLLGGRKYKPYTFTSVERHNPDKLYVLSIDAARACGFEASLVLYRRYPALIKLSVKQSEKERLIDLGKISTNLKHRSVTMTPMRNVYRLLGARLIQNGRWVTDDYYEDEALKQCEADGVEPHSLVGDLDPETSVPAQTGQAALRSLGLNSVYTLGGPSTHFGGAGIDPWSDAGLGNKRSKLIASGVTQSDWMYRMAAEARMRERELRRDREARLRKFEPRENNNPIWVYALEHEAEVKAKAAEAAEAEAKAKAEQGEGVLAAVSDEPRPLKKRKLWSFYEPGVVRGLYEPHTHTPHVPHFTQPNGARFERLSKIPCLATSSPHDNIRSAMIGCVVGPGAYGIASVEYALENGPEAEATHSERLAQIQAAEEWEVDLKHQRRTAAEARTTVRRGTASLRPSAVASPSLGNSVPATPATGASPAASVVAPPKRSLLAHLQAAFGSLANPEALHVTTYVSQFKRTNALFPYATNPPKCWQQEFLVTVSSDLKAEDRTDAMPRVLVAGVSAFLYYLPQTSSSVLYISKIDSSGYAPSPLPITRVLARSFIGYFTHPETRLTPNVWVQLFARAQRQYLFANSSDGGSKKYLPGLGLCSWWKRVLEDVILDEGREGAAHLTYFLPSYGADEAAGMIGLSKRSLPAEVTWRYLPPGDMSLPSPYIDTQGSPASLSISSLIPSLPDDPKTRFLDELVAEVPLNPSLTQESTSHSSVSRKPDDSAYRALATAALKSTPASEFWERMGFRQECASGDVTGFFTLATVSDYPGTMQSIKPPTDAASQLTPAIIDRIGKALLNFDFGSRALAFEGTSRFEVMAKRIVAGELGADAWSSAFEVTVPAKEGIAVVDAPKEPEKPAVVLQARKKKK